MQTLLRWTILTNPVSRTVVLLTAHILTVDWDWLPACRRSHHQSAVYAVQIELRIISFLLSCRLQKVVLVSSQLRQKTWSELAAPSSASGSFQSTQQQISSGVQPSGPADRDAYTRCSLDFLDSARDTAVEIINWMKKPECPTQGSIFPAALTASVLLTIMRCLVEKVTGTFHARSASIPGLNRYFLSQAEHVALLCRSLSDALSFVTEDPHRSDVRLDLFAVIANVALQSERKMQQWSCHARGLRFNHKSDDASESVSRHATAFARPSAPSVTSAPGGTQRKETDDNQSEQRTPPLAPSVPDIDVVEWWNLLLLANHNGQG